MNKQQYFAQRHRAAAVIERFATLWPQCFAVYERRRRPLKIGIAADILDIVQPAIAKGLISADDVKLALKFYTGNEGYRRACARAGARWPRSIPMARAT
jgi:sRNA-binding protein